MTFITSEPFLGFLSVQGFSTESGEGEKPRTSVSFSLRLIALWDWRRMIVGIDNVTRVGLWHEDYRIASSAGSWEIYNTVYPIATRRFLL